ncbi:MAG: MFS transporter [Rhodospirillaceae bacterium]|nr:MFS transporter [Rhodospirillaceae bacterium]
MNVAATDSASVSVTEEAAIKKAFRYLVPWLMLFYVLAYIDRINIGFAALTMNAELGLTFAMFGIANTAFYVMFSLFEVPSNMMLAKYGARVWIPRIMITWGLASIATMFAVGPYSLYALRALVGLAEAGLLPGIVYYMGYWFPQKHRARANAIFLAALPLSLMIGSPLSGLILQMDGFLGLAGWRWLFIIEGVPSVLLGFAVYFILPERPKNARWLSEEEKTALQTRMDKEHAVAPPMVGKRPATKWQEVRSFKILALAVSYFCILATANSLGIWAPLIVKELLGNTERYVLVGFVTAIPPLFAMFAMQWVSRNSDRLNERTWHTVISMALGALGWMIVALTASPYTKMLGLTLCFVGTYSAMCVFWAMAAHTLSRQSQAVGIALISSIGTLASMISPTIIGYLRERTENFNAGIWYTTILLLLGVTLMVFAARRAANAATPVNP